ncbi:M6 family metalloprotease domain-containing protein [Streptomyces bambusae]|uniref:M6 family metalloprotease domain-containing protein n=1 Tax=Streptomyces bambusae TaxID=1550616 RepID=UPI001CFC61F6|nr:M6 family metalloprotease domain-containing protein [Streptomyces bambusae]MCB5165819.1 M6 family metalloprotease domain-containing protein [Streptomyces bambusae]
MVEMSEPAIASATPTVPPAFCAVAPSPELRQRLLVELNELRNGPGELAGLLGFARTPRPLGLDDGTIFPPDEFPSGTSRSTIAAAAADRAPLRGTVRVIVVLADFSDQPMEKSAADIDRLFFSLGAMPHGSVREYFREVTNGLVDLVGEVVGPFRMPETMAWYANGNFGIGRPTGTVRSQDMAQHAVEAADPTVNFAPFDNDGNGYVDAFIVVHAGPAADRTGNPGHIWSHKYVLPAVHVTDGTRVFGYLTISEEARIGVCAHELGHLLFGFPDLYDTDDSSEGVGRWCLMGAGSWNGGGDVPGHPSAWCKVNQGWAATKVVTAGGTESFPDVKTGRTVHRLWKNGAGGSEYFLLENRQRTGYDAELPGEGLLIWHIDESRPDNTDENHYRVRLVQADNQRELELSVNRGDDGDPFPGSSGNTSFTATSAPDSDSHAGAGTCVSVTRISPPAATMTAEVSVSCGKSPVKEVKEGAKEQKDFKDRKDLKDGKEGAKDVKEPFKERKDRKDVKDRKEGGKDLKEPFKERKDLKDVQPDKSPVKEGKDDIDGGFQPPSGATGPGGPVGGSRAVPGGGPAAAGDPSELAEAVADLQYRLAALERAMAGAEEYPPDAEPFIGGELRPDLHGGPRYDTGEESLREAVEDGDAQAKRAYDGLPQP